MSEKPVTVIGAVVANLVIAVAKFAAAGVSGSSAMVAEGIHSVVDTGNELLLLVGLRRAKKPPDETHPYGYGMELYFWSLLVSMILFSVGGGMSIYEGIHHLQHPGEGGDAMWSYITLGVAFVAEGASWLIAVRAVGREGREARFMDKLHRSKDPTKFVVVGEDSAALLGLVVAFVGVLTGQLTGSIYPDAIASMVIGAILCATAVYLLVHSKHLLIGESTDPEVVADIRRLIGEHEAVRQVGRALTMHLGPQEVMVNVDIQFQDLSSEQLAQAIDELEVIVQSAHPQVRRLYIEAQSVADNLLARVREPRV